MRPDSAPQDSPLFSRGPSSTARLILLGLASVLLMMADHRGHYLDRARGGLTLVVYPLQQLAALPGEMAGWLVTNLSRRGELVAENQRLTEENLLVRGRLQRFAALQAENERLRALLDTARNRPERLAVAEIERVDLDPFNHRVLVNRGTRAGVYEGQPVLDEGGVLGQIVEAGPLSAYAMLISDPNHAVPVQLNRTGLRTLAFGTGRTDHLALNDMPLSADVRRGDLLVTSGLGGRFPAGLPVARISAVRRDPGQPFAEVSARPVAALDRARLVLLVWPDEGPEQVDGDTARPDADLEETP